MIQGNCVKCSKQKSQFISEAAVKKGGFIFTVPAVVEQSKQYRLLQLEHLQLPIRSTKRKQKIKKSGNEKTS